MSIRAQRESYKLEIVRFLKAYQTTTGCNVSESIAAFLRPHNLMVPHHLLELAEISNEKSQELPSHRTISRWYSQLNHLVPDGKPLTGDTPKDLLPTLVETQAHLRRD